MSTYAKIPKEFLLEDHRLHRAAGLLSKIAGIPEEWAVHCVASVRGAIDNWLVARGREGEDGRLPGDGFAVLRSNGTLSPEATRAALKALMEAGLLSRVDGFTVRVGFQEDYADLIKARDDSRKWRANNGKGAKASRRRRVSVATPTRMPSGGVAADKTQALEPLEAVAVASQDSTEPVVAVASVSTPTPAATAPGGTAATACGRCRDGRLLGGGSDEAGCCSCPDGRARALRYRRAVLADEAQARRADAARGRTGDVESVGALVPRLAARIGFTSRPPPGLDGAHGSGVAPPQA